MPNAMGRNVEGTMTAAWHTWPAARPAPRLTWLAVMALLAMGCDSLLKSNELPTGVTDPGITQTPEGAVAAYNGALKQFRITFGGLPSEGAGSSFSVVTGLMTDELQVGSGLGNTGFLGSGISRADLRDLPDGESVLATNITYNALNQVRGQASQAIGLLTRYRPQDPALAGHLYALQGYGEIFLAELFCSGIPLSTLDFDGDYTLQPGSSTEQVFTHASALFDTALALAGDSARFVDLARVGKGRALLGMGHYAEAAAAVAPVLDTYSYTTYFIAGNPFAGNNPGSNFALGSDGNWAFGVADREGSNGLDYRSSDDPRTAVTLSQADNGNGFPIYRPNKYASDGSSPIVVASGVEARLIEAEAALHAGDAGAWLDKLNHLRQIAPTIDPTWPVLPDTTDPGSDTARVSLLFRERAFWLFLTGHRQGDLRRLIRQYGRESLDLYPTGSYPGGVPYGGDVTAPIPSQERDANPLFTGCISRSE